MIKKNFWPLGTACGILVPQPGIELVLPALETQNLTTGKPGKLKYFLLKRNSYTWLKKSKSTKWYNKGLVSFPPIPIASSHPRPRLLSYIHFSSSCIHIHIPTFFFLNKHKRQHKLYCMAACLIHLPIDFLILRI